MVSDCEEDCTGLTQAQCCHTQVKHFMCTYAVPSCCTCLETPTYPAPLRTQPEVTLGCTHLGVQPSATCWSTYTAWQPLRSCSALFEHPSRLCHDDVCDHRLDRYTVSEMVCMLCGVQQPVAGGCRHWTVTHAAMHSLTLHPLEQRHPHKGRAVCMVTVCSLVLAVCTAARCSEALLAMISLERQA